MKRMSRWIKPLAVAVLLGTAASAQGQGVTPTVYQNGGAPAAPATDDQSGMGYAGAAVGPASPQVPYSPCGQAGDCCPADGRESGWLIHGDWLYWNAHRGGLDFAIDDGNDPAIAQFGPADIARSRPEHDSGFRIGVFRESSSGLDYGVRYTHFDSDTTTSLFDPAADNSGTRINPSLLGNVGLRDVSLATSEYDLDYRLLDIETGYRIDVNCDSSVRPFAGIRFAKIDQSLDTRYEDALGNATEISESMDMDSWGLYVGSDGQYGLGRFHVFGRGAVGLHHARFDGHIRQFDVDLDTLQLDVTDGDRRIAASLEAQVGLGCQVYEGCRGGVGLQVGYDLQKWFNMADFIRFNDDIQDAAIAANDSSLGLDGWFVRLLVTR